jgi:hypothetical protein
LPLYSSPSDTKYVKVTDLENVVKLVEYKVNEKYGVLTQEEIEDNKKFVEDTTKFIYSNTVIKHTY